MTKRNLILSNSEAHLASLCVAIVSGTIGGSLAKSGIYWYSHWYTADLTIPIYWGLIFAGILGFAISWVVCQFLFPSAHKWYNPKSWYHRAYDTVGVISGVLIYYFMGL